MVEDLPVIRTAPTRRRYVPQTVYRRRKSTPFRWLALWLTSAAFGLAVGYAVLLYLFDRDPFKIGDSLPKVTVEWRR